jgi:WD40 repeat protein
MNGVVLMRRDDVALLSLTARSCFTAVGGDSGVLSILSSKSGWVLCNQFKSGGHNSILATKWSPAGRYLAFSGSNKTCRVIDTITWTDVSDVQVATCPIFQDNATDAVSTIDWSVDGKWVALGSAGGGIHVLGTVGWQLLAPSQDRLKLSADAAIPNSSATAPHSQ